MKQLLHEVIPLQRRSIWGDENYREYGSTAIIRLDGFMPDEDAWNRYYSGEGDFPEDCLGIVITGLRKAAENPDIENVIFDLTCNSCRGAVLVVRSNILNFTTCNLSIFLDYLGDLILACGLFIRNHHICFNGIRIIINCTALLYGK